jgi:hypothetical protein
MREANRDRKAGGLSYKDKLLAKMLAALPKVWKDEDPGLKEKDMEDLVAEIRSKQGASLTARRCRDELTTRPNFEPVRCPRHVSRAVATKCVRRRLPRVAGPPAGVRGVVDDNGRLTPPASLVSYKLRDIKQRVRGHRDHARMRGGDGIRQGFRGQPARTRR